MRALAIAGLILASQIGIVISCRATQVTLAWDPSADTSVTGYNLYYGQASGNYTNIVACGPATSVVVSNLAGGTTYYFAATAVNEAGLESGFSTEVVYQTPSIAGRITMTGTAQIYDGTPKQVSISTSPSGLAVKVTYNGSTSAPVAAGSYQVVATIADPNYAGVATNILVVSKAAAQVQLAQLNQVFDGTPKPVLASTIPAGLNLKLTYAGSASAPLDAGNYQILANVDEPNYTGNATNLLIIARANAAILLSGLSQVFDGTPKFASASTVPSGLAVNLVYAGRTSLPVNAGTYPVAASIAEANYSGTASNALVIAKAPATVCLRNLDQIYDGTPRGAAATTVPAGLAVVLTYNGQGAAPCKPGSYTVVGIVSDTNYAGAATNLLRITRIKERPTAGAAPFSANTPQVSPGSGASPTTTASLHWEPADGTITIFQSTDLKTWRALTNLTRATGSWRFPQAPGARFFSAPGRPGGTNSLRLWISKP